MSRSWTVGIRSTAAPRRVAWVRTAAAGRLVADLVEEGERASVALERVAEEVAHRALDLALRLGGQPEPGERLDVLALVRLQELQRVEA